MLQQTDAQQIVSKLRKLGMDNEQIIAAAGTVKSASLAALKPLLDSWKIPLVMATVPAGAAGYVWGRTSDNESSEDHLQNARTRRKADESLNNLKQLMKARERRLDNEKRRLG